MRFLRGGLVLAVIAGAFGLAIFSQSKAQPPGTGVDSFSICSRSDVINPPASGSCVPVSAANPLPVDASVSASISGFEPATTGTAITADTNGETGSLPAGEVVVVSNVGTTNIAYCKLGASATVADQPIAPNGGWFAFTVGAATQLTCITSTSTTTVNMVGGSGLPTGTGGGGGGGASAAEGATGSAVPSSAIYLGVTDSGTLRGVPGDATNGMYVNVRNAVGLAQGSTTSGQTGSLVMGAVTTAPPTYTTAQTSPLSLRTDGATRVGVYASNEGGATPYFLVAANSNNSTSIKGSAGTVYSIQTSSISTGIAYLKLYDKATAPTCGTDTPVAAFLLPGSSATTGSGNNSTFSVGKAFTLGIGICLVTGIANSDNTAVAASTFTVNIDYK